MKQQLIPKIGFNCEIQATAFGTINKQVTANYFFPSCTAEIALIKINKNMHHGELNVKVIVPGKE